MYYLGVSVWEIPSILGPYRKLYAMILHVSSVSCIMVIAPFERQLQGQFTSKKLSKWTPSTKFSHWCKIMVWQCHSFYLKGNITRWKFWTFFFLVYKLQSSDTQFASGKHLNWAKKVFTSHHQSCKQTNDKAKFAVVFPTWTAKWSLSC